MKNFKLFMVLDMLKSNLRDYLYARERAGSEQEEKYIFIFFKLLKCLVIFSCTQLCLMLGAVLINPALTKLSVIHALPKEENLNILSQNIYRKILPKEKNIFLCSSQIEKNSIRSPKNKAFNRKLHKDAIATLFSHQTETNIGKSTNTNRENRLRLIVNFLALSPS